MKDNIIVDVKGLDKFIIKEGSKVSDLLKRIEQSDNIIAAKINGEIVELSYELNEDVTVELIHTNDSIGKKIYLNGLKFLYITAIKELYGKQTEVRLMHSIDKGIYTYLKIDKVTDEVVKNIKEKMIQLVNQDLPIEKISTSRKSAIKYFTKINDLEKVSNYNQMSSEYVVLYQLLDYYNYFYYLMPISTGVLKNFDLTKINSNGIVLQYPTGESDKIEDYKDVPAVLEEFRKYRNWAKNVNVRYVSDINKVIIDGKIKDFIQLNEMKSNNDLHNIANHIIKNKDKIRIILIGGPSSSGKTTTSKKMALELKSHGLNPLIISVDDYFINRVDTPKDKNGNYMFDVIEALDINLFNDHLTKLLNGESVKMPTYNFITGEKEYKKAPVQLGEKDIMIIEGLHTLNEKLTSSINRENKYKIYISPFTPLGLDKHNHISTIDVRLIRRMVRDYSNRGYSAEDTLRNWKTVRKAEDEYVFPYQHEADVVYNTALIYEIGLLKTFAIPLLYSVKQTSEEYIEALRLLHFLKLFFNISVDALPNTSILREFVGNGYFD